MSTPVSDLDKTRRLLEETGFVHAGALLPELLERAVKSDLSLSGFLESVLAYEHESREERRVRASLKISGLPQGKTVESFDFGFQREVNRREIEMLATCEFVRRKENVLFLGPPGVGKSHLAAALGVKAVQCGFSVAFLTADELLERLRRDDATVTRKSRRRRFMNAALLVVDELGFQALDRRDAHLLFKVVSGRYERGSIVLTSNKGLRDWPQVLAGDEVLATAILDRLLHRSHVVQIDGGSFRLREMEKRLRDLKE